ncbi:Pre-mRNA-splicing factor SYF2 [Sorochytrium milnesiophthora]
MPRRQDEEAAEDERVGTNDREEAEDEDELDQRSGGTQEEEPEEQLTERQQKLRNLRRRLREAENQSYKDIIVEQENKRVNSAAVHRQDRKRKEAEMLLAKQEAKEQGKDWDRLQWQTYSVEDVERWEEKQEAKKQRTNDGFTDFAQAAHKKYQRMVGSLKPDLQEYNASKAEAVADNEADAFYKDANNLESFVRPTRPSQDKVQRMVDDLRKQVEVRHKSSRRRAFNPEEDINYINDKNRHFNKKISRAYDKYTAEIRDSFERGTAL